MRKTIFPSIPSDSGKNDQLFRLLVDAVVDYAIYMIDPDGFIVSWNTGAERVKGYKAEEVIGKSFEIFFREEDRNSGMALEGLRRAREEGRATGEGWRIRKGGEAFLAEVVISPIWDEGGRLQGYAKVTRDITQKKAMEEMQSRQGRLVETREQLRVILDGISDAILVHSREGTFVYANQAAAALFGYPSLENLYADNAGGGLEVFGRRYTVLDEAGQPVPAEKSPVRLGREGNPAAPATFKLSIGPGVSEKWVVFQSTPVRNEGGQVKLVVDILRDVTEARDNEEKYRQAQKMEAVGRLAGGIAHDFNNLLTAINGYAELGLARTEGGTDKDLHHSLGEIRDAGLRAAALTHQLLAFSRKQILTPCLVSINDVLERMDNMLKRLIGEDIQLLTSPGRNVPAIRADVSQVEQVILNLAVNARDAMPDGGRLTMETALLPAGRAGKEGGPKEGDSAPQVMLAVSDDGMGMDAGVMARIFEPFFTTKGEGRGTGLGLSTVYGIMKQSGGTIEVHSEPGRGTTFRAFFPAASPEAAETAQPAKPEFRGGRGRGEVILLVEDEEAVRSLVCRILTDNGYSCLAAENGEQALALGQIHPGAIDLLLTDVILKGMSGRLLAERMRSLRPAMRVLYMSGYTDNAIVRHGVLDAGMEFINKPFTVQALLGRVASLIGPDRA